VRTDDRCRRPSVITEDMKDRVEARARQNRRFTIDELHEDSAFVSLFVLYEIVTVQLRCT
jgi:hypothetical protein